MSNATPVPRAMIMPLERFIAWGTARYLGQRS